MPGSAVRSTTAKYPNMSKTDSDASSADESDDEKRTAQRPGEDFDEPDMGPEESSMAGDQQETRSDLHEVQSRRSGRPERVELVKFKEGDEADPKNWSKAMKWWITIVVALTCFCVAFDSAVITSDIVGVSQTLDVSEEVALLSITLFVVGFGVGPMVFAPLSEILGRRLVYGTTLFVAVVFIIPCAVAQNIETLLVCRLIDGIAFSAPMTLVAGTLADIWKSEERGVPMATFSAAPFCGPVSRCHARSMLGEIRTDSSSGDRALSWRLPV